MKTVKKIKNPLTSRRYRNEARELLVSYGPQIHPCKNCHHPVMEGYCCTYCGDDDPGSVCDWCELPDLT